MYPRDNRLSLERTNDVMTAGITNIPLTKPAFVYFICDMQDENKINQVYDIFALTKTPFHREDNTYVQKVYLTSDYEVSVPMVKAIWRNFKSLKPKIKSDWRYLFWEIDNQNDSSLEEIVTLYKYLKLPVYIHKTMRGYHFLSVKPIPERLWNYAISKIRKTNPDYPPVTLRIQANKYMGEMNMFKDGYIIDVLSPFSKTGQMQKHYDTYKLREWIEGFNLQQLQQQYIIVFYPFPDQIQLDSMNIEERTQFQLKQIEESN